jgi:hypothetical protein
MTQSSPYRQITSEEFSRERTRQFAPDSPEVIGIRFPTISHEEYERLCAEWASQDWRSRLGPISQVMPLDYERYAGIVLPFVAYRGQERHEVDGPSEAYRSFGLSLSASVTLDQLYNDFRVIEGCKAIPGAVRAVLDRFAGTATAVLVKSARYGSDEAAYWTIERELFFALEDPLAEVPHAGVPPAGGLYAIFPRGEAWYMHHPGDTPILYVAGSADLVTALSRALDDRLVRLALSDKYHT